MNCSPDQASAQARDHPEEQASRQTGKCKESRFLGEV